MRKIGHKEKLRKWRFRIGHSELRTARLSSPKSHYSELFLGGKGFTLIEIIILIVMAAILLPAIIVPFVAGVKASGKPEMATTAMYLAHQKMEEFMKYRYLNAALNPTNFTGWAPTGFTNYDWRWQIYFVDSNFSQVGDGITATNHRGYKRIIVQVRDPMQDIYEIYSVVAFFH